MKSSTTERFRDVFKRLPEQVQRQAREAYKLFRQNPQHPSLRFKQVHPRRPIYSVRITGNYRALGARDRGEMIWFRIGFHADYDNLISRL